MIINNTNAVEFGQHENNINQPSKLEYLRRLISVTVPKDFPFDIDEIIKNYSIKVSRLE